MTSTLAKRILALAAICACQWAAAVAAAPEPLVRAPYRLDYGGWYTVSVTIDGKGPYDFIIDTGATHSLVFENLASVENFPPSGGPPQRVLGVSSAATLPTYRVGDLGLGAVVMAEALCVILPDWTVRERSPRGVLGLDFLASYRLVIDAERRELLLYDANAPLDGAYKRWAKADLTAAAFGRDFGDMYVVAGYLGRRKAQFIVDLGAAGTVVNRAAISKLTRANQYSMRMNPIGGASRLGELTDAHDETTQIETVAVERFRVGRKTWVRRLFVVHDAQIFDELGVQDQPFGLFGADLLHDYSFVLDFPGGRMLVGPRSSGQS